jgi:hypothetical protein
MCRGIWRSGTYSLQCDRWIAWQFHCPEHGAGAVQAFRRGDNREPLQQLRLRGLDPDAHDDIKNFDVEGNVQISGRTLLEQGLTVDIQTAPGSAVIVYQVQ